MSLNYKKIIFDCAADIEGIEFKNLFLYANCI